MIDVSMLFQRKRATQLRDELVLPRNWHDSWDKADGTGLAD